MTRNIYNDARKLMGLYPYNDPSNPSAGDGYFQRDCENFHGAERFAKVCDTLRELSRGPQLYVATRPMIDPRTGEAIGYIRYCPTCKYLPAADRGIYEIAVVYCEPGCTGGQKQDANHIR